MKRNVETPTQESSPRHQEAHPNEELFDYDYKIEANGRTGKILTNVRF